jgi:dienelactone hydrolase
VTAGTGPDAWWRYFPDHYLWSIMMLAPMSMAPWGWAEIGEVDRVGRALQDHQGDAQRWFDEWTAMADHVAAIAVRTEAEGSAFSAARHWRRVSCYRLVADLLRHPKDDIANAGYAAARDAFDRAVVHAPDAFVERVAVPFAAGGDGAALPSLFARAAGASADAPRPAVIALNGFEGCKEYTYMHGYESLARDRGVHVLAMDSPGIGEALRTHSIRLRHDYEVVAAAAIDHLSTRPDVDASRIAIVGSSFGGYLASRAASREPRLAAAVAWGAIWDYHADWSRRVAAAEQSNVAGVARNLLVVFGVDSTEAALERLEPFRLADVVGDMRCPFLVVHGEHDQQISLADAQRLFEGSGSADKTLKVFTGEEGGAQHCQIDNLSLGSAYVHDWLVSRLSP